MASPDIIDFDSVLAPISENAACGVDLRDNPSPVSPYQILKTARAAARAAERKSIHDGDTLEADEHWRKIITLAPQILATESKDLEVACWLTEALTRFNGFQGVRDAFKLIHGLLEGFWEGLYPLPDEDGLETRTSPISGLNGEGAEGVLIAPIRKIHITEERAHSPFNFWQYQQVLDAQRIQDENLRDSKLAKLGFNVADIERAVKESSSEFFVNQRDDVTEAIAIYKAIGDLLGQYCGAEAPPTRNIISVLEEAQGVIAFLGKDKFPAQQDVANSSMENLVNSTTSESNVTPAQHNAPHVEDQTRTRERAFEKLLEIAAFFRKTEPHSPISYVIEKAVKWGNMPLDELIIELIPDSSSRERFSELTGVKNED